MLKYRLRHSVSSSILIKYKLWPKWFVAETYYGRTGVWLKRLESHWISLRSPEILNRPVFVLDILKSVWKFWKLLKILKRFWTLLKILNRFLKFWKLLTILNRFWTLLKILNRFRTLLKILNRFWKLLNILNITENSEHCWKFWTLLKILNRSWTLYFFLNRYILLHFH